MILTVLIQFFLIVAFGTTVEWEGKFSPFCPVTKVASSVFVPTNTQNGLPA